MLISDLNYLEVTFDAGSVVGGGGNRKNNKSFKNIKLNVNTGNSIKIKAGNKSNVDVKVDSGDVDIEIG